MSLYKPAYRMTVYAGRNLSDNAAENVVMTPAAGAPHSDAFQVTTLANLAGWKPYLGIPSGRSSRFDPVKRSLDVGTLTVTLLDKRTGNGNTNRWATAFIGNTKGETRIIGNKAFLEESLDNGATWAPFFVGRVYDVALASAIEYRLEIREYNDVFKLIKLFSGLSSGSVTTNYMNEIQLLPFGLTHGYGNIKGVGLLTGSIQAGYAPVVPNPGASGGPGNFGNRAIQITADPNGRTMIPWSWSPQFPLGISLTFNTRPSYLGRGPYCHVISGSTTGLFYTTFAKAKGGSTGGTFGSTVFDIGNIYIEEVPTTNVAYLSLTSMSLNSNVNFYVSLLHGDASEETPLFLDDVHPVQFLQDLYGGYFSLQNWTSGLPMFNIPISSSQFSKLIADTSIPASRWRITEVSDLQEFPEKFLYLPFNLGYRMEPLYSGSNISGSGNCGVAAVYPFDCRMPTSSAGLLTITEADLDPSSPFEWDAGLPKFGVAIKYYEDTPFQFTFTNASTFNAAIVKTTEYVSESLDLGNLYASTETTNLEGLGIRFNTGETKQNTTAQAVAEGTVHNVLNEYVMRTMRGPATIQFACQRNTNTRTCRVGDFRILNIDQLPDPVLHTRGGTRIAQCIERIEDGPILRLRFVDTGANVSMIAPTVGTFATASGDPYHVIQGVVSYPTGGVLMVPRYAATETSASTRPDNSSSFWTNVQPQGWFLSGTISESFKSLPAGKRIWPAFRVQTMSTGTLQMPSQWVFPTPAFVDMRALTAPTTLTYSGLTYQSAFLSWSNAGDSSSVCEIWYKTVSGTLGLETILSPNSTFYSIMGLTSASNENPYTFAVRHSELNGGVSAFVSVSVSLSGSLDICPPTNGLVLKSVALGTLA